MTLLSIKSFILLEIWNTSFDLFCVWLKFVDECNDGFDTTFLENLSQGGLTTLKLLTVHLDHSASEMFKKLILDAAKPDFSPHQWPSC